MSRVIFPTEAFERRLVRFLKQHRELAENIKDVFRLLEADIHHPNLKTHKLHGKMKSSYACSINYHYRIVFKFDQKYIYPDSIGDHDDVY
jgi:addiction module RelE/StbE family toxin